MIRIAHFADVHEDVRNRGVVLPALRFIVQWVNENNPDAVVLAGDLVTKTSRLTGTNVYDLRSAVEEMAEERPVIVIPGNHDLYADAEQLDVAFGLLAEPGLLLEDGPPDNALASNVHVCSRPTILALDLGAERERVQFVAMPFPSRHIYMAQKDGPLGSHATVNAEISAAYHAVLAGLAAQCDPDEHAILVMHASVEGGEADSEETMTTGDDICVKARAIPDVFDGIMAGHLHKAQEVGRVVYSGAICPHTFGQEAQKPSLAVWTFEKGKPASFERIPIPVPHPLITIDVGTITAENPTQHIIDAITERTVVMAAEGENAETNLALMNARVRILARLPEARRAEVDMVRIGAELTAACVSEWKPQFDYYTDATIRLPDVTVDMSMDVLLDKWCELHWTGTADGTFAEELRAFGRLVESKIPPEFEHLRGTDYEPVRLWWQNWKQHGSGEVRFADLGRLVCITGANTAGKSNVAETEPFALYKALVKKGRTSLRDAIRIGETSCEVGLEFKVNGKDYKVVRTISVGKGDRVAADLLVCERTADSISKNGWKPIGWGDATETQKQLEKLVGSLDIYLVTRFGSQADIDRILTLKPAELKDALQQALGTQIFEVRKEIAEKELKATSLELVRVQEKEKTHREILAQEPELRLCLEGARKDREAAEAALRAAGIAVEVAIHAEETARLELAATKGIEKEYTELNGSRLALVSEIATLEKELATGARTLAELKPEIVLKGLERLKQLRTETGPLRKQHDTFVSLSLELQALTSRMGRAEDKQRTDINTARAQVDLARSLAGHLKDPDLNCINVAEAKCKLLGTALTAQEKLPALEEALAALLRVDPVTALRGERDRVQVEAKKLEAGEQRLKELERALAAEELNNWEVASDRVRDARTNQQVKTERLHDREGTFKKVTANLAELQFDPDALGKRQVEVKTLEAATAQAKRELTAAQAAKDQHVHAIGGLEARLKACEEAATIVRDAEGLSRELARLSTIQTEYIKACSRDGLPFMVLEKALPSLETYANEFLGVGQQNGCFLRVDIDPLRDLTTGEQKNEVTIWFSDERGKHPLSEASGFQRMALGYTLRCALAKVQAEATGTRVNLAWLDEGWGAFSDENLALGQAMLRRFAEAFQRVMFITHVGPIKEIADTVITVIPDPDGSRLEIS